jgi:hypothetical protein
MLLGFVFTTRMSQPAQPDYAFHPRCLAGRQFYHYHLPTTLLFRRKMAGGTKCQGNVLERFVPRKRLF